MAEQPATGIGADGPSDKGEPQQGRLGNPPHPGFRPGLVEAEQGKGYGVDCEGEHRRVRSSSGNDGEAGRCEGYYPLTPGIGSPLRSAVGSRLLAVVRVRPISCGEKA